MEITKARPASAAFAPKLLLVVIVKANRKAPKATYLNLINLVVRNLV